MEKLDKKTETDGFLQNHVKGKILKKRLNGKITFF